MERRNATFQHARAYGRELRWVVAGVLAATMGLGGCASTSQSIADGASQAPVIGLPADAPARPAEPVAYPAVHDLPPPRNSVVLTGLEQQRLEADLIAARDRQQAAAGIAPAGSKMGSSKTKDTKSARRAKPTANGSTAN
jgi:hypothetical protein